MKKMVAIIFILGLFMVGCDGEDGVDGLIGPTCSIDQKVVKGACVALTADELQAVMNKLCEGNTTKPKWDSTTGACIA